jgi:hypothetical protein
MIMFDKNPIRVDCDFFESLNDKLSLTSIIEKSTATDIIPIGAKRYCLTGAVGTGTGIGWESIFAYEAIALSDYTNEKRPLFYSEHSNDVFKGNRERSYDGLLITCKGDQFVLIGNKRQIIPNR